MKAIVGAYDRDGSGNRPPRLLASVPSGRVPKETALDESRLPPSPAEFTIAVQKIDDVAYYTLEGELDFTTAAVLLDAVSWLDHGAVATAVFDCRQLAFVDARGLTALLRARAAANEAGAELVLIQPPPILTRVLRATALTDTLPVADTSLLDTLNLRNHTG
jgi:anti-sigma B factor antagonist